MKLKRTKAARSRIAAACSYCVFAFALPTLAVDHAPDLTFIDGSQELQKLQNQVNSWNDYTCLSEQQNFKTNKTTNSASRFFFKKGPVVRIEVVGGGFRDGSVVVRSREGKITAKGGPWMGGIQMDLDPDSRMLILPSGVNVMHADLPELFASLKDRITHGESCKLSTSAINDPDFGKQKILLMEFRDQSNAVKIRLHLSADDHSLLRWDSFRPDGGKTQTWFKNLKTNTGLNEELFKL